ncbi:hypothetical protein K443DRAFT_86777 [Laccaria amethystina LaAM-08-1]|uniref:Protein BIG1 n=1 Tax=Laccaria amethystina LaAM-08-1 TaxID=1095629 RepID=A0A0C9Y134_9AGAR|nr:hypothetical protein K443DRAFT_86777 [Laccaria amethystina LaAM-08-1]
MHLLALLTLSSLPFLHASDLRTLSPHTHLARSLSSSHSSKQFPYVQQFDASSLAESISSDCQSRLLRYALGDPRIVLEHDMKHVLSLEMPQLLDSGKSRKEAMTKHESILGHELSALASIFPSHLIIYAGAPLPAPSRRQLNENVHAAANTTLPAGGILKRYQLLTPGLITVLLVTFFLLTPLVMFGINALASIQNPLRVDAPKGFNAQEKKNQ